MTCPLCRRPVVVDPVLLVNKSIAHKRCLLQPPLAPLPPYGAPVRSAADGARPFHDSARAIQLRLLLTQELRARMKEAETRLLETA
jgi:hypothetical protein